MTEREIKRIKELALKIRHDILLMTYQAGINGGHLGGALSSADVLAVLYGSIMNISPQKANSPLRDRFILSKGHIALAHYAALTECGFISREEMLTFEAPGGEFPTHEEMNVGKGIEISGGSLGYGLSIGVGSALAARRLGVDFRTYVLMGDGECNEGTVWEAAMAAAKYRLDSLTAVVDVNGQQLDGYTDDVMPVSDIAQVFRGFGFHVVETDGNSVGALMEAFNNRCADRPSAVIAHTVKGKGVREIEGKTGWHHAHITQEQYERFLHELEVSV